MTTAGILTGASIAITGGTGSFGSTMVTALLERGAARVNILSRDETKQDEMRRRLNLDPPMKSVG